MKKKNIFFVIIGLLLLILLILNMFKLEILSNITENKKEYINLLIISFFNLLQLFFLLI